jgi:hypothetical protein
MGTHVKDMSSSRFVAYAASVSRTADSWDGAGLAFTGARWDLASIPAAGPDGIDDHPAELRNPPVAK